MLRTCVELIDMAESEELETSGGRLTPRFNDRASNRSIGPGDARRLVGVLAVSGYLVPTSRGYAPSGKTLPDERTLKRELVETACMRLLPERVFGACYSALGLSPGRDPLREVLDKFYDQSPVLTDDPAAALRYVSNAARKELVPSVDSGYDERRFRETIVASVEEARRNLEVTEQPLREEAKNDLVDAFRENVVSLLNVSPARIVSRPA